MVVIYPRVYSFEKWIEITKPNEKCKICNKYLYEKNKKCQEIHNLKLKRIYNKQKEEDLKKYFDYYKLGEK